MTEVGVPEITPVAVFNDNPVGNAGDMEYAVTLPVTEGFRLAIVEPTVKILGDVYVKAVGAISVMAITTSKLVLPPGFVAVTVYGAEGVITVGVPEIIPVVVFNVNPAGNAGETL